MDERVLRDGGIHFRQLSLPSIQYLKQTWWVMCSGSVTGAR